MCDIHLHINCSLFIALTIYVYSETCLNKKLRPLMGVVALNKSVTK